MIVSQGVFHLDAAVGAVGFKVLLADDCAANRRLFQVLFERCGCSVTLAEDGREALAAALNRPFDLICLDRHMPHLMGDEVARAVRAACFGGRKPFLVLCTSDTHADDPPLHFDAALAKPVSPQAVASVVARALHRLMTADDKEAIGDLAGASNC